MTLAADLLRAPLSRCAAASAAQKRAAGRAWIVLTASPELWAGTMQPLSSIHAEGRVNGRGEPSVTALEVACGRGFQCGLRHYQV